MKRRFPVRLLFGLPPLSCAAYVFLGDPGTFEKEKVPVSGSDAAHGFRRRIVVSVMPE